MTDATPVGRLLAVDIGNSHTILGIVEDSAPGTGGPEAARVVADWRVITGDRTADEWVVLLRGLLGEWLDALDGIVVCATVPSVLHEWRDMLARHFTHVSSVVVEPGVRTGVPIQMDNPREVGTDRIANAVAAVRLFGGPAIVVDFGGTATTFDVVDPAGQYVGGAIAPGIEVSLEALGRRGAQLRKVEIVRPRSVIARNTVEAVQSGMVFGVAAQVDGMIARMIAELDVPASHINVISTGYLASTVVEECGSFTHHSPWLTLLGLQMIFARNR